jgi:hypothetical protein
VSFTEVNGEIVVKYCRHDVLVREIFRVFLKEFRAHGRAHPRSAEIYAELYRLSAELKEHGHKFDPSCITRPLSEHETVESVLCGHSEKLAIAFNLIQRPRLKFIQITNNLRMCPDCRTCQYLLVIAFCHQSCSCRSCNEVDREDSAV